MTWWWVALGAAVGAPARYVVDRVVQARHDSVFPWGTLLVNVIASFGLGVVVGAADTLAPAASLVLGPGLFGALSTYSTFSYETLRLVETRAILYAVLNVLVALTAGVGAATLGWLTGLALG